MNTTTHTENDIRQEYQLCTVSDIRRYEKALFEQYDSFSIMQCAARELCSVITTENPHTAQRIHVVLGTGNNAGDGVLVAAYLHEQGYAVTAYRVSTKEYQGDAADAYMYAENAGLTITHYHNLTCSDSDIIVEGIFGIGLDRPPQGAALQAIQMINQYRQQRPTITVYAIDVPAGIHADTGVALGNALIADTTVTFIGDKVGLHTSDGPSHAGNVIVKPLAAAPHTMTKLIRKQNPHPIIVRYDYLSSAPCSKHLQSRNSHKGNYGHSLIIGGGQGMFGAAALSSISALKSGAGKASIYAHPTYDSQYHVDNTPLYEVMRCHKLHKISEYSSIVLGPGLGRNEWSEDTFNQTIRAIHAEQATRPLALLIDADGLYYLSHSKTMPTDIAVITPHEAEAARLLNTDINTICSNKPMAVLKLAQHYRCITVLKGSGTLISNGKDIWINSSGNHYLATAGTGDVLAGIIGGYLAQGAAALDAALLGVFRHGHAADHYAQRHPHKSLRASDIWEHL